MPNNNPNVPNNNNLNGLNGTNLNKIRENLFEILDPTGFDSSGCYLLRPEGGTADDSFFTKLFCYGTC